MAKGAPIPSTKRVAFFYVFGQQRTKPANFTRAFPLSPTPGGRRKVRQLIDGRFLAYVEMGPSRRFRKVFYTFSAASAYAHAAATIARAYKGNSDGNVARRQHMLMNLMRTSRSSDFGLTHNYILNRIDEEILDHRLSHEAK